MEELYSFELPGALIAQEPASPRDHARLLVYDRTTQKITDDYFYNLLKYLDPKTLVVANNSKVKHCRYLFNNSKTEIFAVETLNDRTVRALVRPGKKFKLGSEIDLGEGLTAKVTAINEEGLRTIVFSTRLDDEILVRASHVPLPPYIKQNDDLAEEYQTIYARRLGSLAAPTAGLHFTKKLKDKVAQDFDWAEVTLEVGLGTFASLSEANFRTMSLHSEKYEVDSDIAKKIASAIHITAVGTTTLRTLETLFQQPTQPPSPPQEACRGSLPRACRGRASEKQKDGIVAWQEACRGRASESRKGGMTDIFITPGYEFRRVDSLITNFHLPSTSLLLLVEAFVGNRAELERIYNHAIHEKYRFYSFGDAMLII